MTQHSTSHAYPPCLRSDGLALGLLLAVIALAWMSANSKWSAADWQLPEAYLESRESDILGMLATFKAASEGHYFPMGTKKNPFLGAPDGADWADIPTIEEIPMFLTGLLARTVGIFAALNLKLLMGHLLAGATFFLVARFFRCEILWAFLGGLSFGLAPFLFSESPHHSVVALAWHVPLFLVVWAWASDEKGMPPGSPRFWIGAMIAFITGLQNVYYTNIFCQITLLTGFLAFIRKKSIAEFLGCLGVIAAAALAFFLMGLDTWIYQLAEGKNPEAIQRPYHWLEIYALKPVDWMIPSPRHHIEAFRDFAAAHNARVALVNEGTYLGLLSLASLLWIFGATLARSLKKPYQPLPMEFWQILWIVAVFALGGLNSLVGVFGLTVFRAGYRATIVIQAIALLFFARRMSDVLPTSRRLSGFIGILLTCIVLLDQVPAPWSLDRRMQTAFAVRSDKDFVESLEEMLPEGAMILQLPPMEFPESPAPGLTPYEHFRPYLFSSSLRFSFGGVKGRTPNRWAEYFAKGDLETLVSTARSEGFSGILISRNGFQDGGASLVDSLQRLGLGGPIKSPRGDLLFLSMDADVLRETSSEATAP